MQTTHYYLTALLFLTIACGKDNPDFEGSGVFEAHEVVVSAQVGGQITDLQIEEGTEVRAEQTIGHIDCEDFNLQKAQVEASKEALVLKKVEALPEIYIIQKQIVTQEAQVVTLETQLRVLTKERDRLANLVTLESAPTKQLDDAQGQVDILEKQLSVARAQLNVLHQQIESAKESAQMKNRNIMSEDLPMQAQINRIENQISNCDIINPIDGIVIAKYAEPYEIIGTGKPLYKVADLSEMTLRAYLSGDQLTSVKLNQEVSVLVDDGKDAYRTYPGVISWISDKAEFTPKTIQTKSERANLVYAVKVTVKNDGYLRIGMYGELDF